MNEQEARRLLDRYLNGLCTPEEKAIVENWFLSESQKEKTIAEAGDVNVVKEEIWAKVRRYRHEAPVRRIRIIRIAAAASLLFVAGLLAYRLISDREISSATSTAQLFSDTATITPGSNKATLTLSGGGRIELDDATGLIAMESGVAVIRSPDGFIRFEQQHIDSNTVSAPQRIETPRGGECRIVLTDGTKVWLNASSELSFTPSNEADTRLVKLSGEAYFEVSKDRHRPFIVETRSMQVLVTGTQFNVSAYNDDEDTRTTLVEGSVEVSNEGQKLVLAPGQQATNTGNVMTTQRIDVEAAVAWKNGLFRFDNDGIEEVMKQISRWYDMSVVYKGNIPTNRFGGYISRKSDLHQVLKMLELSGVRFSVEGRTIVVH